VGPPENTFVEELPNGSSNKLRGGNMTDEIKKLGADLAEILKRDTRTLQATSPKSETNGILDSGSS
jgi:hypothetical protein